MATDPVVAADALVTVLRAPEPVARFAAGDGSEDLLALASQPVEAREATVAQLLASLDARS